MTFPKNSRLLVRGSHRSRACMVEQISYTPATIYQIDKILRVLGGPGAACLLLEWSSAEQAWSRRRSKSLNCRDFRQGHGNDNINWQRILHVSMNYVSFPRDEYLVEHRSAIAARQLATIIATSTRDPTRLHNAWQQASEALSHSRRELWRCQMEHTVDRFLRGILITDVRGFGRIGYP